MDLCEFTKKLWAVYYLGEEQENFRMMEVIDPDCVIIGTGKHEFYRDAAQFSAALAEEIAERQDLHFQIRDLWCQELAVTPQISLVYGGSHIWWESEDRRSYINMDCRFSILYRREGESWRIIHIHQSMPSREQGDGEYYLKTLREQIEESQEQIQRLSRLARNDALTGLINYRTFQELYQERRWQSAWLFIIDVDDFKQINDTYGHLFGNHALQRLSRILSQTIRFGDLVCRMGGDEFVLLCEGLRSRESAAALAERLLEQVSASAESSTAWMGISLGITPVRPGEPLDDAFTRADSALYAAKAAGKNRYIIADR